MPEVAMTLKHVSLTMRADTTAADIQDFLDRASKYAPSVTSGLRARRDVEKTGGSEAEVVVLYVRTDRKAEALGDKILLLLDDVCAYFTARAEHSLAAQTLLERANIIKPIDETPGQTALYTHIDKVLNEEYRCLTAATASDVWGQAFPAYDPRGFWKELTGKLSLMYQTTRETRENIDALKDKISYLLFNQQRGVGGSARRSLDRILPGAIQQRASLRYLRALYDLLLPLQSRDGKPEFIAYSEDCMDGFSDLRTFCAVYKKAFDDERPQPASQNDVAALAPELLDEREFKALNLIVRFVMDINDRCPASRTASHGSDESLQPASEPDLPDKTKESEIVPVTKPCGEVQRETLEVEKQGTLRQYVDARAGIPKNEGQKNGQTPRQIIDEGMKQLSYFESMLAGPDESVGHTEKTHLAKFFSFLGYEREDSASLVMQFEGFTAIHKMICLPNDPGATPAQISETEWR
jgi:hypothetical protein